MRAGRLLGCLLLGCGEAAPPAVTSPAVTSPAASPADTSPTLVQRLYGGEQGAPATRAGDRVRLLLWIRALSPDQAQLDALAASSLELRADLDRLAALQQEADAEELAHVEPLYSALFTALARPDTPEETLEALASALPAPRALDAARLEVFRALLDRAAEQTRGLRPEQEDALRSVMFVLREPLSRTTPPGLDAALLADAWRPGDFGTLRRVTAESGELDISALWTLSGPDRTQQVTDALSGPRLVLLVALAVGHPEFPVALDAYRSGQRNLSPRGEAPRWPPIAADPP